jgi:hypothetical protein
MMLIGLCKSAGGGGIAQKATNGDEYGMCSSSQIKGLKSCVFHVWIRRSTYFTQKPVESEAQIVRIPCLDLTHARQPAQDVDNAN